MDLLSRSNWDGATPNGDRSVYVDLTTQLCEGQQNFQSGLDHIDASPIGEQTRKKIGTDIVAFVTRVFRIIGLQIGYPNTVSPIIIRNDTGPSLNDLSTYKPSTSPGVRVPYVSVRDDRSTLDFFGRGLVLFVNCTADIDLAFMEDVAAKQTMPLTVSSR